MPIYVEDHYQEFRKGKGYLNSTTFNGESRYVVDAEGKVSIDNSALRIKPLLKPGWGRAGVIYGPYQRQNGLALVVNILNGHNASHTGDIMDSFLVRMKQWLRGSYTYPRLERLLRWLFVYEKSLFFNKLCYWYKYAKGYRDHQPLDINLAVGWFKNQNDLNPIDQNNSFFIRSTGPENGELIVQVNNTLQSFVRSIQNIPLYLVVILREIGAAYYAATLDNVPALSGYPNLQPLAIDPSSNYENVYGGFFQSVAGQIGFRVDTRVYETMIGLVNEFSNWYGTAHVADRLDGNGSLVDSSGDIGGYWRIHQGSITRSKMGAYPEAPDSLATMLPSVPTGLIHALVTTTINPDWEFGLVWRFKDLDNYLIVIFDLEHVKVLKVINSKATLLDQSKYEYFNHKTSNALQVVDRGNAFQIFVNGTTLFKQPIACADLQEEMGVGFYFKNASTETQIHSFEAHPREIRLPDEFMIRPLEIPTGKNTVILDDFLGENGQLDGSLTKVGCKVWRKVLGGGQFRRHDGKCVVEGSYKRPNPGRTLYTVKWDYPDFADLTAKINPPISNHNTERGRGGLVFYQDSKNYIIVSTWLDNSYGGSSISSFFQINGFEDIYDAVWTNVGKRVQFGVPYELRVTFDGLTYIAYLNREPVLYRSLNDIYPNVGKLQIMQVGIVANWEWGDDTGSQFESFIAKTLSA